MLQEEAFPAIIKPEGDFPTWFQKDSTPEHYTDPLMAGHAISRMLDRSSRACCWPPRSPGLTRLAFYRLWFMQSLAHLRVCIVECCAAITPDILNSVMEDWRNRKS